MSYQKTEEPGKPHEVKTLLRIMKMAFNPPDKSPQGKGVTNLDPLEKKMLAQINKATVLLMQVKYMFIAFKYSLNVLYKGRKILNAPNTVDGLNAMMAIYGRSFSPVIKHHLKVIVSQQEYWELKKISAIDSSMYLTIIKTINYDALKRDTDKFLGIFREYYAQLLSGK